MPSPIPAISEDYSDIIVKKQLLPFRIEERYQEQPVDRQYSILYAPLSENLYAAHQIGYISVPKLYTFISLSSLASFLPRHSPISDSSEPEFSSAFSTPASTTGTPPSEKQTERPGSLLSGISPIQPELHRKVFPMAVNIRRMPSIRPSFLKSLIASFPLMILTGTEPPSPGLPAAAQIRRLILPVRRRTAPWPS